MNIDGLSRYDGGGRRWQYSRLELRVKRCMVHSSGLQAACAHRQLGFLSAVSQEEWRAQVEGLWDDLKGEDGAPQVSAGGTERQGCLCCLG